MKFRCQKNMFVAAAFMFFFGAPLNWAEGQVSSRKTVYGGPEDRLVTIHRLALMPFTDNLNGIYSRPLEQHLTELIKKDHHWDLEPVSAVGPLVTPADLESDPKKVASIMDDLSGDGFLVGRITKGPRGINMKINLFLKRDGNLFAQEVITDYERFEIKDLKEQVEFMLAKIKSRVPYNGLVLSRQGQRITTNLGKEDGIMANQVISVVQIIKLNRHPKFNFVISSEKEIIGKIRILKVDKTLSFGKIISEIEAGAIQRNAKISGLDHVTYTDTHSLGEAKSDDDHLMGRPDGNISFGKGAKSWVPQKPPTFGQVGAKFGIGMFNGNQSFGSTNSLSAESLEAKDSFYPSIEVEIELWLTPRWSMHSGIRQGIIDSENPADSSNPSSLSMALGSHELLMGYNLRLGPSSVWGPRLEFLGGFASYKLTADDTDNVNNREITTMKYSGLKLGASGQYPISPDYKWSIGSELFFLLNSKLDEKPQRSGSPSNTVNQFTFFVNRKLNTNFKAQASLDYELYSTTFSGSGGTTASRRHIALNAGLFYLF